jgi:uncharacterized protein (TIGR03545 family)
MKWSYIIPRAFLIIIIYLFFYFAFDPILKWGFVKALESTFEAKADIKDLKTSFLHLSLNIKGLSVGNKDKEYRNLFEFKELRFSLLPKPLFEKKFVINEAFLSGLEFSTPRKTSCKIKIKKTQMPAFVENYLNTLKSFATSRIDDIKTDAIDSIKIDANSLDSVKLINELKEKYNNDYKNIDDKINFSKYDDKIKEINKKIDAVKKEKNFIKQMKLVADVKKDVDSLLKDYNSDKKEIERLINQTKDYYDELNKARENDINKVSQLAKLPELDKENISKMLIGESVMNKISYYYTLAQNTKKYIPDNPKKKVLEEKKKRGRIISYPKEKSYPKFLLVMAHIDGVLTPDNPIAYSASVQNLTTQPHIYPKPIKVNLYGKKDDSSISLYSVIDIYSSTITSKTDIKYYGAKLNNLSFGNNQIKLDIPQAFMDTSILLETVSDNLKSDIKIFFRDVNVNPSVNLTSKYDLINRTIEQSLSNIKTFTIDISVGGRFQSPSISFKTDIAEIISSSLQSAFKAQVDEAKKQISKKIDDEINKQKESLDKMIKDKQYELQNKLKLNTDKLTDWQNSIKNKIKL